LTTLLLYGALAGASDLVILKEGTPGATAAHEGAHQRAFGLHRVVQVVRGPRVVQVVRGPRLEQFRQRDGTKRWMPRGPSQVVL